MPDRPKGAEELSPVKRALYEIQALRARVAELESVPSVVNSYELIAIVGAGLRFPGGATDEQSFWSLLSRGRDAITEIPRERWDWRMYFDPDPDASGSMYTRHGGFLDGVDLFDAAFFGISPREAAAMDPQHRLALEVGWEALENSGHSPAALQGSPMGVFLGIANNDYGRAALTDLERVDAYTGSGNSPSMVAGRLSYVLGLHGPSLAIDTSCSSSLVAVHLACQSLRAGECKLALAGGVNLILTPESNIALSKAHMMSPDGRCKAFDEAADGYVRSEGCCIVVLKKLADAQAEGDRILAVIRGSAVNHDGRSGGLTAPSGPAQAAVIGQALETAGVAASEISYVETHGTGTSLGDPIEVETLASVLGKGRSVENPLAIGAVKTNIGHAEAASGIAGLMKTVLALRHHAIPPSLHLKKKNSHIGWDRLPVVVPTQLSEWKPVNGHRYAGVSSFGFSGTNAHVVLEEAPERNVERDPRERREQILAISARTESALDRLRGKYVAALRACPADELADLCFTANAGRTHFGYRIAVVGDNPEQMAAELERDATLPATGAAKVFIGNAEALDPLRVGFLFTGQGSQYGGMGRELYESSAVFRAGMERCTAAWKRETGESLIDLLYPANGEANKLEEARYAQPALFAFEYALAEMWRSWGVEPSVVLGHSLGEYVAAVIAGVFSVEEGMRLVCARARLMDTLSRRGAMRSVSASAERVGVAITGFEDEVAMAAINGSEAVVISGEAEAVERVARRFEAEGIRTKALAVTHAFHSPMLEPILEEFEGIAGEVKYHAPRIRMISNLTGEVAKAEEITTARYWREHMRRTVQFDAGLKTALATGCDAFLEIGPQPHLKALAVRTDPTLENRIGISIRRQGGNRKQMLETLAQLYIQGQKIDWKSLDKGVHRFRIALPTYPFERQRYWLANDAIDSATRIWRSSTAATLTQSQLAPIGLQVESFPAKWECLERLTIAEILNTLRAFGAFEKPGVSYDAKSLAAECGISPTQTGLLRSWLNLLCEAGYLERDGPGFQSRAPLPDADVTAVWREVEVLLRDDPFLLEYLRNCSKHLRGIMRGTTNPLETLFPSESPDLARNLYENSGGARYANLIVASAVQAVCAAVPANRKLRIVELGGGTGATTSAILPKLPPHRVSYHFTDISDVFLQRASTRFSEYPFVRYGLLDIEDRERMASHAGSFDVVIAANVVHATRDLQSTLRSIAGLLAPGGIAILLEATRELAWREITIGLIEGWQKPDDDLRGTKVLLSVEEWNSALRHAGFEEVASAPEAGSPANDIGLHVILARGAAVEEQGQRDSSLRNVALENTWNRAAESVASSGKNTASPILALLQAVPSAERRGIMLDAVCEEIARILRLAPEHAPKKRDRLMDLGMDSLMAVELRNRLGSRLGLADISATLIFDYPTPDAIAGHLLELIDSKDSAVENTVSSRDTASNTRLLTAEEVADLPDEEIEALLRGRLAR